MKTKVHRENVMGALVGRVPTKGHSVFQSEVMEMQIKFSTFLFKSIVKTLNYTKLYKNFIPGYKEGMRVDILEDYRNSDNVHIFRCALKDKQNEWEWLYENKRPKHLFGELESRSNKKSTVNSASDSVLIKIPEPELDRSYRSLVATMSIDYLTSYDPIPFNKEQLYVSNAPEYIRGFYYITNNAKLELLVKYLNENGGPLKDFLSRGGLKSDEFIHLGMQ